MSQVANSCSIDRCHKIAPWVLVHLPRDHWIDKKSAYHDIGQGQRDVLLQHTLIVAQDDAAIAYSFGSALPKPKDDFHHEYS